MCAQVAGEYGLTQEKWSRYSEFTNRGGNSLGESFKGCYQGAQDSEKRERGSAAKELGKVNKVVCVTKEILEKKKATVSDGVFRRPSDGLNPRFGHRVCEVGMLGYRGRKRPALSSLLSILKDRYRPGLSKQS